MSGIVPAYARRSFSTRVAIWDPPIALARLADRKPEAIQIVYNSRNRVKRNSGLWESNFLLDSSSRATYNLKRCMFLRLANGPARSEQQNEN